MPRSVSKCSSSLSPSAAPLLGQQGPLKVTPSSFTRSSAPSSVSSNCSAVNKQVVVEQPSVGNSLASTPALQRVGLASNVSSDGQDSGLQQMWVSARRGRSDGSSDRKASDAPQHRLSRCTHAADLPVGADEHSSSASCARQWLRSVSFKGESLKAEAVREAGRVIRRVSAGDLAVKASVMTVEAKKKSAEWLLAKKHS